MRAAVLVLALAALASSSVVRVPIVKKELKFASVLNSAIRGELNRHKLGAVAHEAIDDFGACRCVCVAPHWWLGRAWSPRVSSSTLNRRLLAAGGRVCL